MENGIRPMRPDNGQSLRPLCYSRATASGPLKLPHASPSSDLSKKYRMMKMSITGMDTANRNTKNASILIIFLLPLILRFVASPSNFPRLTPPIALTGPIFDLFGLPSKILAIPGRSRGDFHRVIEGRIPQPVCPEVHDCNFPSAPIVSSTSTLENPSSLCLI